jgi:hypothetical protein
MISKDSGTSGVDLEDARRLLLADVVRQLEEGLTREGGATGEDFVEGRADPINIGLGTNPVAVAEDLLG